MAEKLTLCELQLIIRDSLYMSFPDMYWVIAEISEIKENYAGHCYLELIEKQKDDNNIRARVKGIIWCKRYGFLKSYFENITGESLREGLKVLLRVKIEYHELYGLSLVICDIDPSFTLGELAMKRQLIIRQLEQEGVFSMNKELGLPVSMQKIAVISSASAAGYTDFMDHLINNDYGYVFYTRLFESPMQGSETEQGIVSALDRIAANQDLFDVVVIIRGGGSQLDLSWFDNYNIAYHITQFPLPVLTGIGHEKDMSVSDLVAFAALKTPTAVADFIVNHMSQISVRLDMMLTEIKNFARLIFESNQKRLESSGIRLMPLSRLFISETRDILSEKSFRLITSGGEYLRKAQLLPASHNSRLISGLKSFFSGKNTLLERHLPKLQIQSDTIIQKSFLRLETYEKNIDLLKPENVLRRGYTMTYRNGSLMKKKQYLANGDIIDTRFSDGVISSRIIEDGDQRT